LVCEACVPASLRSVAMFPPSRKCSSTLPYIVSRRPWENAKVNSATRISRHFFRRMNSHNFRGQFAVKEAKHAALTRQMLPKLRHRSAASHVPDNS